MFIQLMYTNLLLAMSTNHYERAMGDSELSYYLPSRADGVNDMFVVLYSTSWLTFYRYLHLGFKAPPHLMRQEWVTLVWSILRMKHPLLASKVEMHSYEEVHFV